MTRISPLDPAAIPALQALSDELSGGRSAMDLRAVLTDSARGGGTQAAFAWHGERPVGCVGWVALGIEEDGRLYGSPLVALDAEVARSLIDLLDGVGRSLGATHLRISKWEGEAGKAKALADAGFERLFEWVTFSRETGGQDAAQVSLPPPPHALQAVPPDHIDWARAARLYAECFRDVPNAPRVGSDVLAAEWRGADWVSSRLLQDAEGCYVAFLIVQAEGQVDVAGVDAAWRGRGLADWLYTHALAHLALQHVPRMTALVASSNAASMRLHQRLGFTESQPRGAVWERPLRPLSDRPSDRPSDIH